MATALEGETMARKRSPNPSSGTLVFRVQTRFIPELHPDAISLLSNLPSDAVSHTITQLVQLGARVHKLMLSGPAPFLPLGIAGATSLAEQQGTPPVVSVKEEVFNPLAAIVSPELAAEAFALPRRPA